MSETAPQLAAGISDEFARWPLTSIIVDRDKRQRRDLKPEGLVESIRTRGVLNPVIIRRDGQLVAGERRLEASKLAGLPDIPIRFLDEVPETELAIIELEENIRRLDLTWQDLVRTVAEIHGLYKAQDGDWTLAETGDRIGLGRSVISMYLRVWAEFQDERISQADTVREAYNIILRTESRAAADGVEDILGDMRELITSPKPGDNPPEGGIDGHGTAVPRPPATLSATPPAPGTRLPPDPSRTILHESFLHWAPKYTGQKFNFLHCDFPYGLDVFSGEQAGAARHQGYEDSLKTYTNLISGLCGNLDRLMGNSGHLMFWYSEKHRELTLRMFSELAPTLIFWTHPLIWVKSDNSGIVQDPRRGPRHIYESCLLASRGGRAIVKVVADAYAAPSDRKWHPSTKPEPVLKHFFSMLVDEHTRMLDPTCGSGSAVRAAEALGASQVLGMDVDEGTVGLARTALRQSRTLGGR